MQHIQIPTTCDSMFDKAAENAMNREFLYNKDKKALYIKYDDEMNQLGVATAVPTKTSDLTNDSNFVSDAGYVHTDNNFTDDEKTKLDGLSNYDDTDVQSHINNTSNPHNVTKEQVGLSNVDNTSDSDKPISTATQTALDNKVDKEDGKVLSDNNFTDDEKTKLSNLENYDDTNIQTDIDSLEKLVPTQASETNQLADKDFVNSSISTNTANYCGTFESVDSLPETATNNDYAFVTTTDENGSTVYARYKWVASTSQWTFEYNLNNSSFTSAQWAAIQSGITSDKVSTYDGYSATLDNKVDKETGKGLSTNDYDDTEKSNVASNTEARHTHSNKTVLDNTTASYTTTEKTKLSGIAEGATNVSSSTVSGWGYSKGYEPYCSMPTIIVPEYAQGKANYQTYTVQCCIIKNGTYYTPTAYSISTCSGVTCTRSSTNLTIKSTYGSTINGYVTVTMTYDNIKYIQKIYVKGQYQGRFLGDVVQYRAPIKITFTSSGSYATDCWTQSNFSVGDEYYAYIEYSTSGASSTMFTGTILSEASNDTRGFYVSSDTGHMYYFDKNELAGNVTLIKKSGYTIYDSSFPFAKGNNVYSFEITDSETDKVISTSASSILKLSGSTWFEIFIFNTDSNTYIDTGDEIPNGSEYKWWLYYDSDNQLHFYSYEGAFNGYVFVVINNNIQPSLGDTVRYKDELGTYIPGCIYQYRNISGSNTYVLDESNETRSVARSNYSLELSSSTYLCIDYTSMTKGYYKIPCTGYYSTSVYELIISPSGQGVLSSMPVICTGHSFYGVLSPSFTTGFFKYYTDTTNRKLYVSTTSTEPITLDVPGNISACITSSLGSAGSATNVPFWGHGVPYANYASSAGSVSYASSAGSANYVTYPMLGNCQSSASSTQKVVYKRYTLSTEESFECYFPYANTSASALTMQVVYYGGTVGALSLYIDDAISSSTNYTLEKGWHTIKYVSGTGYYTTSKAHSNAIPQFNYDSTTSTLYITTV